MTNPKDIAQLSAECSVFFFFFPDDDLNVIPVRRGVNVIIVTHGKLYVTKKLFSRSYAFWRVSIVNVTFVAKSVSRRRYASTDFCQGRRFGFN